MSLFTKQRRTDISDKMTEQKNSIYGSTHLKKRVGNITRDEFVSALQTVADTFSDVTGFPTKVEIALYGSMPMWSTTLGTPEEMEWQHDYNEEKVVATYSSVEELTEEAFRQAVFVQARLDPRSYAAKAKYACGWVSTGGNASHAINLQVQPTEMFSAVLWPKIASLFGANFTFRYSFIHNGTTSVF